MSELGRKLLQSSQNKSRPHRRGHHPKVRRTWKKLWAAGLVDPLTGEAKRLPRPTPPVWVE